MNTNRECHIETIRDYLDRDEINELYLYLLNLHSNGELTAELLGPIFPNAGFATPPFYCNILLPINPENRNFDKDILFKILDLISTVKNLNWNFRDYDSHTILLKSVGISSNSYVNFKVAKWLLNRKDVDVNLGSRSGVTPLMVLASKLSFPFVSYRYYKSGLSTLILMLKHPRIQIHAKRMDVNIYLTAYDYSKNAARQIFDTCFASHRQCDQATLTLACIIYWYVHKDLVNLFAQYCWATRHDWDLWTKNTRKSIAKPRTLKKQKIK